LTEPAPISGFEAFSSPKPPSPRDGRYTKFAQTGRMRQ
jgi:hypothetical protein